jgi:hypothetical protein
VPLAKLLFRALQSHLPTVRAVSILAYVLALPAQFAIPDQLRFLLFGHDIIVILAGASFVALLASSVYGMGLGLPSAFWR